MKNRKLKTFLTILFIVALVGSFIYSSVTHRRGGIRFNSKSVNIVYEDDEFSDEGGHLIEVPVEEIISEDAYEVETSSIAIGESIGGSDISISEDITSEDESVTDESANHANLPDGDFVLTYDIVKDILGNNADYLVEAKIIDSGDWNIFKSNLDYSSADKNDIAFQYSGLNDLENVYVYVYDMYVNSQSISREHGIIRIEVTNSGIVDIDKFILFQR